MDQNLKKPNYKAILYFMTFPYFIMAFLCYFTYRFQEFVPIFDTDAAIFVDKLGGKLIFFISYLIILTIIAFLVRRVFIAISNRLQHKQEPFIKAIILQSGFNTIGVINLLIIFNIGFDWLYMSGFLYAFLLSISFIHRDFQSMTNPQ